MDYEKRYRTSGKMLEEALKIIPLGSQTFSKSMASFPAGVSPMFMKKGRGSRVWDVDGNEYVDFVNALASVTLGYNDPDVTEAVMAQLEEGTIFSLPHEVEAKAATKIIEMVPCAEMVRFGKNGSDATAGAIRLARAYTGRDHVAVCGYHGWQDWYIGSTSRSIGVPRSTRELTHAFIYNDMDSLNGIFKRHPDTAAVIMEPMNSIPPSAGFLEEVRELSHRKGALLIFDETITGFRFAKGGAQEHFGVIPDIATFGKGMANGYPVSAVAGSARIMGMMGEIFFSFTYGGETLSLAAAYAAMCKLQREPVIETLWKQGKKVSDGARLLAARHGLHDAITVAGKDCWSFLLFRDAAGFTQWEIKTLFMQEVLARGMLVTGTHNMSYAHSDEDISMLLHAYDEVFSIISEALRKRGVRERLRARPLEPLFRIR